MLLASLFAQTRKIDRIIIVDNSEDDSVFEILQPLPDTVDYIRMPENAGSAGGYKRGMQEAVAAEADFIWTLDDDVVCHKDSLENLLLGFAAIKEPEVAALRCVGPTHTSKKLSRLEILSWRGSFFKTSAVKAAGLPDASFFLYGDDLEYSLRLSKDGYIFFWLPGALCDENRNSGKLEVTVLGKSYKVYESQLRLYYAFRNEVAIYLKYRRPKALLGVLWYAGKLLTLMLGTLRGKQCLAILSGIADGFLGKMGKLPVSSALL